MTYRRCWHAKRLNRTPEANGKRDTNTEVAVMQKAGLEVFHRHFEKD